MNAVVVWNGTLERQAAEADRRAPEPERERVNAKAIVRDALQRLGTATIHDLCLATGLSMNNANGALYHMRECGELDVCEELSPQRSQSGRALRLYRLREVR